MAAMLDVFVGAFADAMSTSEMTTLLVTPVTVSADPVAGAITGRFDAV
jgi:hypothetical protein